MARSFEPFTFQNVKKKLMDIGGGFFAEAITLNSEILMPDGSGAVEISATQKKWADDFGGIALNAANWDTEVNVGGMVVAAANSNLTINMGTTANAELRLLSKEMFTVPFDVSIAFLMSQRIANNLFYVEAVEVDATTGLPVDNANLAGDWANRVSMLFDGTTVTSMKLETMAESAGAMLSQTIANMASTAAAAEYFMEVRPQDVVVTSMVANSSTTRTAAAGRAATEVPDPNKTYKLRIRAKNGGVAPATATTVTLNRLIVMDVQEIAMEIASGRGDLSPNKGVAVNMTGALPAGSNGIGTVQAQGAGNAATGGLASINRLLSAAASANNTLVKGGAGRIYKIRGHNKAASDRFLKLYNKATAPVAGTDTPIATFLLPAGQPYEIDFGSIGQFLSSGIGFAITPLAADNDATLLTAGDIVCQNVYFA